MTIYYVGPGGSDSNNGTSWATRKLTLNGAEDIPVAAGDTVYVGPGVYREELSVDVSGSSGNIITYIGDVTGEHTDNVGGIVRITGSNNDQSATRSQCILASSSRTFRTFRGFYFDTSTTYLINTTDATDWIIEDCTFQGSPAPAINTSGASQFNFDVKKCIFIGNRAGVYYNHTAVVNNCGHLVENCLFVGGYSAVRSNKVGGIIVKSCTMMTQTLPTGGSVYIGSALDTGQTVTVNNCIIFACESGLNSPTTGFLVENYNTFYGNQIDRTNVDAGANSVTYPPLLEMPPLFNGIQFPWAFGDLSEWSQVSRITGTSKPVDDLYGTTRPGLNAKSGYGAVQFKPRARETTITRDSSIASIKLPDAGIHQIFVPVTNVSTTISIYVYREADYTTSAPELAVIQPGQTTLTDEDAGSAETWNQLSVTFTPAINTSYVIVELRSKNLATTGDYAVYFDDLTVT